eukprot:1925082-Pyramimonas_sp.AAC.1
MGSPTPSAGPKFLLFQASTRFTERGPRGTRRRARSILASSSRPLSCASSSLARLSGRVPRSPWPPPGAR